MSKAQNQKLMEDIIDYLEAHELFEDVNIYTNDHRYSSDKPRIADSSVTELTTSKGNKYYDYGKWNVASQVEYNNPDSVTMTFEGVLYDVINYDDEETVMTKLEQIGKKYGVHPELGYQWSLAFYNI